MVNKFRNTILKCKNYYTALLSTELTSMCNHSLLSGTNGLVPSFLSLAFANSYA